jgi:hypothetical protein
MKQNFKLLSDQELAGITAGSAAPKGNAMPGLGQGTQASLPRPVVEAAKWLLKEAVKTVAVNQTIKAGGAGINAVANLPRHDNPKPLNERTHRWLN